MTAPLATPLLALDLSSRRAALNKLDLMGTLIGTFAPDIDTTDGDALTFGYRGGRFIDDLGGVGFEPDGTIAIPNNATRFVHFDPVNGVTIGTSIDRLRFIIAEVRTGSAAPGDSTFHVEDLRDMNLVGPNRTRHRGAWVSGSFLRNDLVTHLDALWIANTSTTTEEPGTDSEWDLILYGLPDPSLADEDDVLTIVGGVPVWAAPPGGGGGLDVYEAGALVLAGATAIDFVDGATVVDGGGGVAEVEVTAAGGGAGGYPSAMATTQEVLLTADAGIGLADGSAITTWGNQGSAGGAKDHANTGGTDRPIFRATDAEDGLEYVEFDGADDFVECTGMTPYTGGELTGYLVARISDNAASDKLFGLGNTGQSDSTVTTGCCLIYLSQHQIAIMRNNAQVSPSNLAALGGRQLNTNYDWFVFAFRYKVLMGRAVLQVWLNNQKVGVDQGGAALVAFNFDNSILGAGYNVATGTKAARPRMDVRHWSYRLAADSGIEIRDSMRYLANRWKVPILD